MIQDLSGSWCIKGTGESITRVNSPVPFMHHDPDRSWITDPDPDHPKGTQPRSPSGSFRCNKTNCTVCPFIEDGRNLYTFYSTGQTFKIKSHITCETSNIIYMIQCTKCNLQYIGETKRRLKDRFNEHRRPIINPFCSYTPTAVSRHFLTSGHAEDHMILIPLEQLHTSRDSIRKAREAFLIHRGKTLEPAGLNRRDEM